MTRLWAWLTGTSPAAERAMREAAISAAPRCPAAIVRAANRAHAEQMRRITAAFAPIIRANAEAARQALERLGRTGMLP